MGTVSVAPVQYTPKDLDANAVTKIDPSLGDGRRVYAVLVSPPVYAWLYNSCVEDAKATINHEYVHVAQHAAVRTGGFPLVWRNLDDHFGNVSGYGPFREAEGHLCEVVDASVGWFHQIGGGQADMVAFQNEYNGALDKLVQIPDNRMVYARAKILLRTCYAQAWGAFPEMARALGLGGTPAYDHSIRAPL